MFGRYDFRMNEFHYKWRLWEGNVIVFSWMGEWKEMPRDYMVFDRSDCSERIILLHVTDFGSSTYENGEFQENGFKEAAMALGHVGALENAELSGALSIPLLQEVDSWGSSSSEVAGSMADEKKKQQQQRVEMANELEESNCYNSREDIDEIDVLLNLGDKLADTADSLKVPDHRSQRLEETFKILRDLVGGDWMDSVGVLDETIRRVKRLQMDVKNLNQCFML